MKESQIWKGEVSRRAECKSDSFSARTLWQMGRRRLRPTVQMIQRQVWKIKQSWV
jgi:hypothetical protein